MFELLDHPCCGVDSLQMRMIPRMPTAQQKKTPQQPCQRVRGPFQSKPIADKAFTRAAVRVVLRLVWRKLYWWR